MLAHATERRPGDRRQEPARRHWLQGDDQLCARPLHLRRPQLYRRLERWGCCRAAHARGLRRQGGETRRELPRSPAASRTRRFEPGRSPDAAEQSPAPRTPSRAPMPRLQPRRTRSTCPLVDPLSQSRPCPRPSHARRHVQRERRHSACRAPAASCQRRDGPRRAQVGVGRTRTARSGGRHMLHVGGKDLVAHASA